MRFLKTYIEISNICNLQCSFCPEVEREKKVLSPQNFRTILKEVLPFTEQVCLHLMGEPLAHPEFKEILAICNEENAKIHLTTNGTYLSKFGFETFLKAECLKQINFSLHSFKDNFPEKDIRPFIFDILQFSREAINLRPDLYINYRLWNLPKPDQEKDENQEIIDYICEFFQVPINERVDVRFKKSKNILGRVYFHFDTKFEWPSLKNSNLGNHGFCHALSQQIGIHADGTVVPCCLDKEAGIPLGNVLSDGYLNILQGPRFKKIKHGFQKHEIIEELCQKCTFRKRFDKKSAPTELS